ncbi:endonuclease/exonuclease/phosphatase family protein [Microvirga aerophila]|uniref:Endonuclease n=1 Tax=Microvirga aerophila TaxID=670291 RepID=A0A512C0F2_9HYPH|nr:endonuclease/exonuclease/phosphatase family protein [Microvirga aerophila]GEO17537.1 endonuclease [Microvirga aerophila]
MVRLTKQIVHTVPAPDEGLLEKARTGAPSRSVHAEFFEHIEAFHVIERRPPSRPAAWPGSFRIAALNAKRLKNRAAVRSLLDRAGLHAALLSEADAGMARSGNVHTIGELAAPSGEGFLFGVEFMELDLGDAREMRDHHGQRNACGFHGNGIVAALELADPVLIRLEEGGLWFPGRNGAQRRIGGRMALAARMEAAPQPFWLVSVHLESKTDPADRQAQMQTLLRALDRLAPPRDACVIGGDFNTKALPRDETERQEPLFDDLRAAGFSWRHSNVAGPTQRTDPAGKPKPPFGKLDWIVVRGLEARNPQVIPVLDQNGDPASDHDLLMADLSF